MLGTTLNDVELTKDISELADRIWVPQVIKDALAVPWVPALLLGVLGAVLLWRAYWTLYRSTAIPVVRVFILIGYLLTEPFDKLMEMIRSTEYQWQES